MPARPEAAAPARSAAAHAKRHASRRAARPEPAHGQHLVVEVAPAPGRPAVRAHARRHAADAASAGIDRSGARGARGLAAPVASTDLIATLPRQIGEALAAGAGLAVHPSPIPIAPFTVYQHWHARAHHDAANRWLRSVVATLFLKRGARNVRD